jgi:ribosomal protein S18 acetylase RimI-like enzyme
MTSYTVRPLSSDDFASLAMLEKEVFAAMGEAVLCPHYLRLCTEMFHESCFIALDRDRPIGYLLAFVRGREAHCTTLAVLPEYQKRRVTVYLMAALVRHIMHDVDTCWFTVKEDNVSARALHRVLGAIEVERRRDYYGPGDDRIVSRIDRRTFECMRHKYEQFGMVLPDDVPAPDVPAPDQSGVRAHSGGASETSEKYARPMTEGPPVNGLVRSCE